MNGRSTTGHLEGTEPAGASSRFLGVADTDRLTRFYLGFDFEARHDRFGAEAGDDAIIAYCNSIEWRHSILLAWGSAQALDAVVEIHPLSQQWDCAELIVACPSRDERGRSVAELLQSAARLAGARGCRTFLVPSNDMLREMLTTLQAIGRVRIATTQACVDLSGYVLARQPVQGGATALPWNHWLTISPI